MRTLILVLLAAAAAAGQDGPDRRIQEDLQGVLELAAPPSEGTRLSEEKARARADRFKTALEAFIAQWEPRVGVLDRGRYDLARALALAGRPGEAVPLLEAWLQGHPDSARAEEGALLLGSARLESGNASGAVQAYESFLASHPRSERRHVASFYLAMARHRLGDLDGALAALRSVIASGRRDPVVADANIKLVDFLQEAGRVDEARDHLEGLIKENPDAPALQLRKEQLAWIGREAPELGNLDRWVNGEARTLEDLRGKTVVLSFFMRYTDPSKREISALAGMQERLDGLDVAFLGVTKYYEPFDKKAREQQAAELEEFLEERGAGFPVALAGDFSNLKAYDVRGVPHTVVIDHAGKVRHIKTGSAQDDDRALKALERAVRRLAEEE